jgi:hypothetical protein
MPLLGMCVRGAKCKGLNFWKGQNRKKKKKKEKKKKKKKKKRSPI